jgi:subtilisin family serine protease
MTRNHPSSFPTWRVALAIVLFAALPARAGDDRRTLAPRVAPEKPARTTIGPLHRTDRIAIKFVEGSGVRMGARLPRAQSFAFARAETLLAALGVSSDRVHPMFDRDPVDLERERALGEQRSGQELADLTLYHVLTIEPGEDAGALCDALNADPTVELALPLPNPAPPPVDLPPPTPDLTNGQRYLLLPPVGMGSLDEVPGGDGTGITIVDVEYGWVLDHEDLMLDESAFLDDWTTPVDPFPEEESSHGTAVLGVLVGRPNAFGVTGVATGATARVAPANTLELGYDVGRAVSLATGALGEGDVILIEQQTSCVCDLCDEDNRGYGPVEWIPPWFDTIRQATALGIVVVEVAGNGALDLDHPSCRGRFNRFLRDSGAIVVGGGDPLDRSRGGFSTFGRRVDLQGWGTDVVTTGYGDAFGEDDPRQRYTWSFGGTSSASSMVAGAVAVLQGIRKASGAPPLAPEELRSLLVETGSASPSPSDEIGPLPDLPAAFAEMTSRAPRHAPCSEWLPRRLDVEGQRARPMARAGIRCSAPSDLRRLGAGRYGPAWR